MSRPRRYALYFLAWTIYGLFLFSQGLTQSLISRDPTPWWGMLAAWLIGSWVLGALAPIVLWLSRAFRSKRKYGDGVLACTFCSASHSPS